jgi:hypothetical protein
MMTMMEREDCEKGFFLSFDYSDDALRKIESFFKRSHKVIVALTVEEIFGEQIQAIGEPFALSQRERAG